MKVFILYNTISQPFGGANQFMRALKQFFSERGMLAKNVLAADIILLNNHSLGGNYGKVFPVGYLLKSLLSSKIFIHRVDGPVQMYGDDSRAAVDRSIYQLNETVADGTVFQSEWSREQNEMLGMKANQYETIIHNAADPAFFFPPLEYKARQRINLIAASWSDHPNKGFDIYAELDQRLDWSRFAMTFVGRTPHSFKNITIHEPVPSKELGELLRSHDIYVTASKNDPCSNALLEALACGLPSVARASGGHPELVGAAGELFEDAAGAVAAIESVASNLDRYRRVVATKSMEQIGSAYLEFFEQVLRDRDSGSYDVKRVSFSYALRQIFR